MADGGMFPVEPSVFVREIPTHLVVAKRVMDFGEASSYGSGARGSGSRGGFGGFGGGFGGYRKPTYSRTTWRR